MALPRTSTINMKMKGEMGSPFLIPREEEKVEEGDFDPGYFQHEMRVEI
jgi:hypothetical protein